jgi:LysM repeat protein
MQLRFIVIFVFCILVKNVAAQTEELMIQGTTPNLYLTHTVAPKENWYSIGRLYNANPKEIAPYNGMGIDKPLNIGQQIKIALHPANFSQNDVKAADEVFVPVYHVIQDKEWMYRVSVNYNKVPVQRLEKWNGITNDQAKAGTKLIVGFLKVKKNQSALASSASTPAKTNTAVQNSSVIVKAEPQEMEPAEKKTDPIVKHEDKAVVRQSMPVDEKKVVEEKVAPIVNRPINTSNVPASAGGFFRSIYEGNGKSASGIAGIFKSTSGWQDAKYYALMGNVPVGTILRVTNPSTGKIVYAKVLGELPDMKESIGLTIRISDAAASELGVADGKFNVVVSY